MAQHARARVAESTSIAVTVDNVGGIDHADVSFEAGGTVLRGRNATNRTSFLSAVAGALGGSDGSLKSDAKEGSVVLQVGDRRYTRTYRREGDAVRVDGDPYVTDDSLVDTFVSLLENNPARQAVERGENLREIIMRPVDTDEIEARIESLRAEEQQLAERIDRVRERTARLPDLQAERRSLEADLESLDEEIASLREEIDQYEADHETAAAADSLVDELDEVRQERNRVQNEIEVTEAEIESLEGELAELETEGKASHTEADLEDVKEELAADRERRRQLEETINALFTIVEFNRDLLEGSLELPGIEPADAGPVTELAPADERELVCWTCGSEVTRAAIEGRLDALRGVIEEKRAERTDVEQRVADLEQRREEIEKALAEQNRVERRRTELQDRLAEKRERLSTLRSREGELAERIADLESQVAETQEIRDDDLLEMYERLSDRQYERGQLAQQIEDVEAEIDEIRELPDVSGLTDEREALREDIAEHRARIDRLERRAIEAFNRHMDELLDVLEYDNVARVWIEKRADDSGGDAAFDLHVVREDGDGTGYEEAIANLSESERELIGLVFALAGYLAHEVSETVPFILLDSLEAIDSDRIGRLVDHFLEHADVLLVALLPEDARAVDDSHERIPAASLG